MNFNNSKIIPIIIISLQCGTLYIIKISLFVLSLPETFIGLNGLYKIKTYLMKQYEKMNEINTEWRKEI